MWTFQFTTSQWRPIILCGRNYNRKHVKGNEGTEELEQDHEQLRLNVFGVVWVPFDYQPGAEKRGLKEHI